MTWRQLDLFGRPFFVERTANGWSIHAQGSEGKRGPPLELPIPYFIEDHDTLAQYLADLCHEWASPAHPDVRWVD